MLYGYMSLKQTVQLFYSAHGALFDFTLYIAPS